MSWLTLAVLSLIVMVGSDLLKSKAAKSKNIDIVALAVFYYAVTYAVTTIYAYWFKSPELSKVVDLWPIVLANGVLFSVGHTLAIASLKHLDVSLQVIIATMSTIYSVLLATVFLSESINTLQWSGLLLILLAIIVVNSKNKKSKSKNLRKGLSYAFSSALVYGFAVTNGKHLFNQVDLGTFFVASSISSGAFMAVALLMHSRMSKKPIHKLITLSAWPYILIGGIFLAVSDILFFSALEILDNISRLVAVATFSTILTVLAGVIFLRERKQLRLKLLSAGIATIGFLLLI